MTDCPNRAGRSLVIMLSVALGLVFGSAQYVLIVSPTLRTLLNLSAGAFGWLLGSWVGPGVIGSLVGGWLADRGHLRRAAYGSTILLGLSYGLCALPPAYPIYLTGIALTGFSNAALATIANVAVARAYPLGARRALTWLQASIPAAVMTTPPIWAWLISRLSETTLGVQGAVRVLFVAAGVCCLLALAVIAARPLPEANPPAKGPDEASPPRRPRSLLGWPLVMVCLFMTLHGAADNGAYLWMPDFVERRFNPSPFPAAWILSGFSGAYLVGRLALVQAPDRWRDLTLVTIAAGGGAAFFVIAFRSTSQYSLAALYVVAGLFMSVDYPSILSHIGQTFPHATGRVMAITSSVSQGVSVFLPPLMGYVGELTGTMVAGMMIPAAMLGTLSVSAFLWRRHLDGREVAAGNAASGAPLRSGVEPGKP